MTKTSKKAQRQRAIQIETERRILRRKERSPIDRDQMLSLIEFVGHSMFEDDDPGEGSFMETWCAQHNVSYEEMKIFLASEDISDDWSLVTEGDPYGLFGPSETRLAWMPLEQYDLDALLDWLDDQLARGHCAKNHALTRSWLGDKAVDTSTTLAALVAKGGGCDCKILFNIDTDDIYPSATLSKSQ